MQKPDPLLVSWEWHGARLPREPVRELHVGRRSVVAFAGELDIATVPQLEAAIERAIARGAADVWVDLSRTTFMDSAGIHCLVLAKRTLAQLKRHLAVICDEDGPVRRALVLTGLASAFELHPDLASAHRAA